MRYIVVFALSFLICVGLFLLMNAIITTDAKKITKQETRAHEIFLAQKTTKTQPKKVQQKKVKPLPQKTLQMNMKVKPIVQKINIEAPKLTKIKSSMSVNPINVKNLPTREIKTPTTQPTTTEAPSDLAPMPSQEVVENVQPTYETIDSFLVLKRVEPKYPRRAKRRGIGGYVNCDFKINPKGEVFDIKITKSSPKGIFDKVAIEALSKWKFNSFEESKKYKLSTVTFKFEVK